MLVLFKDLLRLNSTLCLNWMDRLNELNDVSSFCLSLIRRLGFYFSRKQMGDTVCVMNMKVRVSRREVRAVLCYDGSAVLAFDFDDDAGHARNRSRKFPEYRLA